MSHKRERAQHNPAAPTQKSDAKETTNRRVYIETGVQVDLVEDLRKEYKNSQDQATTHSKKLLFWSKISALLLLVYVGLTLLIYRANREANELTTRSLNTSDARFRIDQRPYLTAEPQGAWENTQTHERFVFDPRDKSGRREIHIRFVITNNGKSPAIEVVGSPTAIIYGPAAEAREKLKNFVPKYQPGVKGSILALGTSLVPVSELPVLTEQEMKLVANGTWELYAIGETSYRDIFEPRLPESYRTGYCAQYSPVGLPFGFCLSGNYIH